MTDQTPTAARIDGPRRPAAAGRTDSLIVFLHGYGASGDDLFGLSEPLAPLFPGAEFVSPDAPERCRINPVGFQWFPIPWIDGSSEAEMAEGFLRADAALNAFLDAEIARTGLDESRIALVGFSQGTMMSLHVGPRRATPLAGIVGFSGRLTQPEKLATEAKTKPPVILVHGDMDEVIPVAALDEAREGLAAAGMSVRWHVSRGVGHGIAPDGLERAATFLNEVLPSPI